MDIKLVPTVTVILTTAVMYQFYSNFLASLPPPKLNLNEYWGPSSKSSIADENLIRPFKISFNEKLMADLKTQLSRNYSYHEPLEGIAFEYGFNSKRLKEIINYWRDEYISKWKERENYFNKYKHFKTQIQGLNIHFIHEKPKVVQNIIVLPVLLLHGWPGSIREFYDIIPMLTTPDSDNEYVFEVVAPSLPGYGWSEGASVPGFGAVEVAILLRNLMLKLGYEKFLVQGGDCGSIIGGNIASIFSENVIGYHSNMCMAASLKSMLKSLIANLYPPLFIEKEFEDFVFPISTYLKDAIEESGYFHIQATKPETIGIALSDNPIGLAAYVWEKFSTGTNKTFIKFPDGGLERHFTLDELIDNVMVYYTTNSMHTAVRLYAESVTNKERSYKMIRVPVLPQTGCAIFKNDLSKFTDWQLRDKYPNLIHIKRYSEGGHFAALQQPNVLYADFVVFVRKIV